MEHHHHPDLTRPFIPAMSAPPNRTSDLLNHGNPLWKFNVVTQTACLSVAGIVFLLRCYVRLGFSRMPKQWILEDWMVVASFLGLGAYSALVSLMINHEGGVHQWDLTTPQAHRVLYLFWIETIIYGPFIFFTKFAILLLYLRLLVPTRWSALWTTIHIFIGISASFYTAITVVKVWQCQPKERAWGKDVPGHCINLPVLLQVSGLFNTISDALILLVPVKAVWNLRLGWWKKVGVCAIFGIGAVAPVFSAIGFAARVKTAPSKDLTYNDVLILLWANAELTTGVICACLPTLPALIRGPRPQKPCLSTSSHRRSTQLSHRRSASLSPDFDVLEYVELEEARTAEADGKRRVFTEIVEGMSFEDKIGRVKETQRDVHSERTVAETGRERLCDCRGRATEERPQRGIMRTVRIEQTSLDG